MSDRYDRTRPDPRSATAAAFQVRGRFLTAIALRIDTEGADEGFYTQLDEQLHTTPQFFLGAPVVLDFANVPGLRDRDRIQELVKNLRRRDLRVFAVQNGVDLDPDMLQSLGLIPLVAGRDAPLPRDTGPARTTQAPTLVENKVIRQTIRSGQMVVAERGDLTIIGSVAAGAELVAAGNIHVYGALRGRAMAGCYGNTDAHIFCQSLEADLVAIGGLYQTNETLDDAARQRCTHVYLKDDKLCMEVVA